MLYIDRRGTSTALCFLSNTSYAQKKERNETGRKKSDITDSTHISKHLSFRPRRLTQPYHVLEMVMFRNPGLGATAIRKGFFVRDFLHI